MVETAIDVLSRLAVEWEVIVIDDGSSDRTSEIGKELSEEYEGVKLIRHKENRGIGSAVNTGISNSSKTWVFYTDCDGQFDLDELEMMWQIRENET